ncbi:hypothetical protein, partial [Nocardiopsis rhodophaea]
RHPHRTIRVMDYTPGDTRAVVVDARTGQYPRRILASDLHATPVTRNGTPRRDGYWLISAPRSERD